MVLFLPTMVLHLIVCYIFGFCLTLFIIYLYFLVFNVVNASYLSRSLEPRRRLFDNYNVSNNQQAIQMLQESISPPMLFDNSSLNVGQEANMDALFGNLRPPAQFGPSPTTPQLKPTQIVSDGFKTPGNASNRPGDFAQFTPTPEMMDTFGQRTPRNVSGGLQTPVPPTSQQHGFAQFTPAPAPQMMDTSGRRTTRNVFGGLKTPVPPTSQHLGFGQFTPAPASEMMDTSGSRTPHNAAEGFQTPAFPPAHSDRFAASTPLTTPHMLPTPGRQPTQNQNDHEGLKTPANARPPPTKSVSIGHPQRTAPPKSSGHRCDSDKMNVTSRSWGGFRNESLMSVRSSQTLPMSFPYKAVSFQILKLLLNIFISACRYNHQIFNSSCWCSKS